jgi:hypothetical protein
MHRNGLVVSLFVLAASMQNATAQMVVDAESRIRCVQENLGAIGFDPRGVDGRIGPGTRGALDEFVAEFAISDAPEISEETAEGWCVLLDLASACLGAEGGPIREEFFFRRFLGGARQQVIFGGVFILSGAEGADGPVSALHAGFNPYFPDEAVCFELEGVWDPEAEHFIFHDLPPNGNSVSYDGEEARFMRPGAAGRPFDMYQVPVLIDLSANTPRE